MDAIQIKNAHIMGNQCLNYDDLLVCISLIVQRKSVKVKDGKKFLLKWYALMNLLECL